jgi:hypothetical protein
MEAIEAQVDRLLPEGIAKSARNRVAGEIYRELDTTLQGNRALGQQMSDAFRSGALDDAHRRAIVSLVTGRARQGAAGSGEAGAKRMDQYNCFGESGPAGATAQRRTAGGHQRVQRRK